MKKFKFIWVLILGTSAAFTACESLNLNPASSDGESALTDMLFLATTEDSSNVMRGHHGHCNLTEVAVADLPASITDYISANYANATIDRAGTVAESGNYAVAITKEDGTHAGLLFSSEGEFLAERTRKARPEPIEISELPTTVTDYITANYDGSTIKRAFQAEDGNYGVLLILSDESYLGVGFDSEGNFLGELSMKDFKGKKHGPGGKGKGKKGDD